MFVYARPQHRNQVKRQRERFRKEALRREREASLAKGNAEQLSRENQELKRENMHLYKKIRQVIRRQKAVRHYFRDATVFSIILRDSPYLKLTLAVFSNSWWDKYSQSSSSVH